MFNQMLKIPALIFPIFIIGQMAMATPSSKPDSKTLLSMCESVHSVYFKNPGLITLTSCPSGKLFDEKLFGQVVGNQFSAYSTFFIDYINAKDGTTYICDVRRVINEVSVQHDALKGHFVVQPVQYKNLVISCEDSSSSL